MSFTDRVSGLPFLGIGVSTEFGAARSKGALDLSQLRRETPGYAGFLEVGVEVAKGLDADTLAWRGAGGPTTHHFLDINLDEPEDFDAEWLEGLCAVVAQLQPAWMCGDAGLWHHGPRERGNMLLLPPILTRDSARAQAQGVRALRSHTGLEILPENPPGAFFVGDLHILEFFSQVAQQADTGLLLDVAHLAIYQRAMGHQPLDGLADFDCSQVVEIHVAGGTPRTTKEGFAWVDDDHGPQPLADTWTLLAYVAARAPQLKAIVFECERNPLSACLPGFRRIEETVAGTPFGQRRAALV